MNQPTRPRAARTRLTPAARRESILDAATDVFCETGYHRGKTSAIAARIGVSEPVVFQNFGSKSALYRAVLDRAVTTATGLLTVDAAHEGAEGSVSALLATFFDPGHMERFHARGSLGFLFADAATLTEDPALRDAALDVHRRFARTLTELLREGQRAGDVRADLDPHVGAWWLLSSLHARTFRAAVLPEGERLERQLTDLTLGALAAPGPQTAAARERAGQSGENADAPNPGALRHSHHADH
ncbi:TetR/AcrR family transcriptional regulator [Streptomyces sp. VRA16 Mangrove soil]|uniref:TetR/AcrR family transcriptional regulator n=1 Tax=Streptomyces sp. VRA16 Mangrove soil TaxID=2817434 RepID=UPI001A9FD901|nr:TetR/AcrR family transcriptional regulator [Streptomyces sp. VRA16 Mangrove soil]MBO1334521.1 TetR/AcrR family transcriptional regulator [Streptomyces sp. VRA16 Mangrove soil]